MFVATQLTSDEQETSAVAINPSPETKSDFPELENSSEEDSEDSEDGFSLSSERDFGSKGSEKFWISRDLFISKGKSKGEVALESESQSVTCQKIDYNCAIVKEHSQKCSCVTPRLHIYLMFGHQCNAKCAKRQHMDEKLAAMQDELTLQIIKSEKNEVVESEKRENIKIENSENVENEDDGDGIEVAIKVENEVMDDIEDNSELLEDESSSESGNLTIDTEYVVVSDEILKISPHVTPINNVTGLDNLDKKLSDDSFKIGVINNNNNNISSSVKPSSNKIRKGIKGSKRSTGALKSKNIVINSVEKRKNSNRSKFPPVIKVLNTNSLGAKLDIKDEPEDTIANDQGILVNDFQLELQSIAQSINKRTVTVANAMPSQDAFNLLKNFESLIKEEPDKGSEDPSSVNSDSGLASFQVSDILEKEEQEILGTFSETSECGPSNINSTLTNNASFEAMKSKVVGSVSYVSPTKMKIFFSPINKANMVTVKCEPDLIQSDDSEGNQSRENLLLQETGCYERNRASEFLKTCVDDVDETPQFQPSRLEVTNMPEWNNLPPPIPRENNEKKTSSRKWVCNICSKKLSTFKRLSDHLEKHQKDGLILCIYCQKSFGDRTSMKRHMRSHTGERPYQCKVCGKRFSLPGNFKKHRDIHEDIRSEPCEVCGKTFRRREHLKYHMRTHTGEKPFVCSLCPSTFTARYSLQIHMNIHLGKKPYKCSYCSKAFCDKSTMRKHIRTHTGERPFKCKLCFKGFSESGTLASHMATHTEERPFPCGKCELKFKTNGGLRQHGKIHSGVKHFECKYCGMRFLQRYNMTMHERIHTNEKPYSCCECSRCFRSRSCLAKHIVIHAGDQERKHSCSHCDKKFFRKAHLNRHINMHLGVKEYECQVCSKNFCSKATLRGHTRTFHAEGARKFPCPRCGKVFKRQIYVSTHKCVNKRNDESEESEELDDAHSIKAEYEENEDENDQ